MIGILKWIYLELAECLLSLNCKQHYKFFPLTLHNLKNTSHQRLVFINSQPRVGYMTATIQKNTIVWHLAQGQVHEYIWRTWQLEWTGGPRAGRRVWISTTAGWRRGIRRVGRDGKRTTSTSSAATAAAAAAAAPAVWLLEGLWKGGVQGHVWLVVGEIAELYQQAVLWVELAVPRYQDRREHWMVEQTRR